MLAFVPVAFELYRPLKPALRWTLQCLVGFADRAGKCWPSVRTLAAVADISKSSVSRHLAALEREGIVTRQRRAGGVYHYTIDRRFLPRAGVSQQREAGVPTAPGQETESPKHKGGAQPRARFAGQGKGDADPVDDSARWEARIRSWRKSRFWLGWWGPRPSEPGCWAPPALLRAIG